MENVHDWLVQLKNFWEARQVSNILELFTEEVIYYESPSEKLGSKNEIMQVWAEIEQQKDIEVVFEHFSTEENKHAIKLSLRHKDQDNKLFRFSGVLLLILNEENKCEYFYKTVQEQR